MLRESIIRAWKDPEYRYSLSDEERANLPENPAGVIELTDEELDLAVGGQNAAGSSSFRRPLRGSASSNICNVRWPSQPTNGGETDEETESPTWRTPRPTRSSRSSMKRWSSRRSSTSFR